jgi:hypothetical protein
LVFDGRARSRSVDEAADLDEVLGEDAVPAPAGAQPFASTARANNASFNASTALCPQRDVVFINVLGCGTDPPNGMQQNRCQLTESVTSARS